MTPRKYILPAIFASLALLSFPARADVVVLKTGKKVVGNGLKARQKLTPKNQIRKKKQNWMSKMLPPHLPRAHPGNRPNMPPNQPQCRRR
jgi:hypothetical protein